MLAPFAHLIPPSVRAAALLDAAREARHLLSVPGATLPTDLTAVVTWANGWDGPPLRHCHACGKESHATHVGAAQHAAYLILAGGTGKIRVYACRKGRALHVGR